MSTRPRPPARPSYRRIALTVGALVLVLALAACGDDDGSIAVGDASGDLGGEADYRYVIPVGAGEALDRGEPLEVLPGDLEVRVGEIIEIVNEDDRGHLVGPFFVGAEETLRQRFASPGEFIGECTVHPSGQLVLTVVE